MGSAERGAEANSSEEKYGQSFWGSSGTNYSEIIKKIPVGEKCHSDKFEDQDLCFLGEVFRFLNGFLGLFHILHIICLINIAHFN